MESFFEFIELLVKGFINIVSYIFVERIFFDLGYYTLKILTLSSFPKNREEAEKNFVGINIFGLLVVIFILPAVLIYLLYYFR